MYLLGDTFLRGYYVVYDLENMQVGIANNIYNKPIKSEKMSAGEIVGIVIGAILGVTMITLLTVLIVKKVKKGNIEEN